ncbi:protein of unknown function DUF72 [Sulfolobus islandicus Y.G.57.14]|jgi:uncharacterized protein YecE (DUF72 family)|uniref:DUF72 domain-containing protein n=4 Tax=Saccharolobus islandicus TaxID=43080 RepID=C3MQS3_SACI2|nr:DUF72 domain-containing protein [Sulfolobus islandicus]ACP35736.1 protein of unknown function DUF72 [Sulfolobus islandicus L.S.2.15]ACP45960.1 protein of unknown function DUF72 [Sulfolobus islandicus Y.G.57.14]ACP48305.1 protein of unknown function DUF72 [Sulfolobus islandicus Y.N.15.51]ADB87525.1 protein of unknown function DUF72 [Sulfolobus islandicus L.D.8.5]
MKIFVGTSGWTYDWNDDGTLEWYVKNSGLNAVEVNMSFYRYPTRKQVERWSKFKEIRWIVKVNRRITHMKRLKDFQSWKEFQQIVDSLNPDFYLFQLPPTFKRNSENEKRVFQFAEVLKDKMAVEFRDIQWYLKPLNVTCVIVSIDSPIGTYVIKNNDYIYLRLHGRDVWYTYDYSEKELKELADKIISLNPKYVYVFFNNNHWMLDNGRYMLKILTEKS